MFRSLAPPDEHDLLFLRCGVNEGFQGVSLALLVPANTAKCEICFNRALTCRGGFVEVAEFIDLLHGSNFASIHHLRSTHLQDLQSFE